MQRYFPGVQPMRATTRGSTLVTGCGKLWAAPRAVRSGSASERPDGFRSHAAQATSAETTTIFSNAERIAHRLRSIGDYRVDRSKTTVGPELRQGRTAIGPR